MSHSLSPGEFKIDKNGFFVGCGDGNIKILELQQEGKKVTDINSFLNGYRGDMTGKFD